MAIMRACVELNNFGFTSQALKFAYRSGNTCLIKLTGDCALRFADFDTAKKAYNELAMKRVEGGDFNWGDYSKCF